MTAPTVAETLARWSGAVELDQLPAAVLTAAKRCMVDIAGVALAGSAHPTARLVRAHAERETAHGECIVFGSPERYRPTGAALANAVAAHALDFDDTCYDGIAHGSAAVFPAVLAGAEVHGAPGRDLVAAFIAGVEVVYALGRAFTDSLYWRGWWTTAVLGTIGAAAGTSRVLGLDAHRSAHAIASAAALAFGARAVLGTAAKPLGVGRAAEAGVRAALLAAEGLDGPLAAFEEPRGFARLFNDGVCDGGALESLGRRFSLLDPGIAFKLYPACSAAQAAAEAVEILMREHRLTSGQIARVECAVTPLVAVSLTFDDPQTITQAQFSMPFAIGSILRFGRFGVAELAPEVLRDGGLRAEMRKVAMTRSDDLVSVADLARYPEAAAVTLLLADGRTLQRFAGAATGMPANPMSDRQLDDKFLGCATRLLGEPHARECLARLWRIEQIGSARTLFA